MLMKRGWGLWECWAAAERPAPMEAREDDGEGRLAAEHVVNLGHLVDDLVHGGEGEGHHAGADDGAEACACSADGGSHVGGLGDGADADALFAELGDQGGQGAEAATEVEYLGVAPHLLAEGFDGGLGVGQFWHGLFPLTPGSGVRGRL